MKTLNIITTCFVLLFMNPVSAGTPGDKFREAMQKCISELYNASSIGDLQHTVNALQRIGAAEVKQWEPQYYIAFGYLMMANRETDGSKKDHCLDKAMAAVKKAKGILPADSEIIALEGFVYMLRVTVDPTSRGHALAPTASKTFAKAIELNPHNPRALALSAQMQFGTARFFGTSTAEACALVQKSLEEFNTDRSENDLAPTWGKPMAESLRQQCQ